MGFGLYVIKLTHLMFSGSGDCRSGLLGGLEKDTLEWGLEGGGAKRGEEVEGSEAGLEGGWVGATEHV